MSIIIKTLYLLAPIYVHFPKCDNYKLALSVSNLSPELASWSRQYNIVCLNKHMIYTAPLQYRPCYTS